MTKNREMMNEKELTELAELFKVFGDSSRIKILYALFETEMGVGDIADTIDMTTMCTRSWPWARSTSKSKADKAFFLWQNEAIICVWKSDQLTIRMS